MHTPDLRYVIVERDIFRTMNGKPGAWLPYNEWISRALQGDFLGNLIAQICTYFTYFTLYR